MKCVSSRTRLLHLRIHNLYITLFIYLFTLFIVHRRENSLLKLGLIICGIRLTIGYETHDDIQMTFGGSEM